MTGHAKASRTSKLSGVGVMSARQVRGPGIEHGSRPRSGMGLEKNSVKDLVQEPFSSGPAGHHAGAVRTKGRPTEDRHGPHLRFRRGPPFYIQIGHRKTWELDGAAARTPVGRYSRIAM